MISTYNCIIKFKAKNIELCKDDCFYIYLIFKVKETYELV